MPVEVIRTIASVGGSMAGSGTLSTRTSRRPCQVTAFIAVGYPARHRGARAVSRGVRLPGELLLDRVDLAEATDVALLAGEVGAEVRADHVTGECGPDHPGAEAEHVDVVVLDALVAGVRVVGAGRADAGELARRHGDPGAGAADEHRPLRAILAHGGRGVARGVRVVDRVGRISAEIDRLVAERAHRVEHKLLEREARVIEGAGDLHVEASLVATAGLWSSAHSWAAISAAPRTPARGPWRARRIRVRLPAPG